MRYATLGVGVVKNHAEDGTVEAKGGVLDLESNGYVQYGLYIHEYDQMELHVDHIEYRDNIDIREQ